ncbi:hypothetical protein CSV71_02240 [Sporosarcina sp. P21c]|uniref:lipopolysaccharide biosynthesis protein n=1 Tax=Sporosarcina sp. P21c TaxID=2048255 RepID=UPI000C16348D|nr:polysaccharide biosynthesis C-terminal domain-containing protein [Sporosarcina sp. P21c]PIC90897.1 hypothetical protein CSV71_02240 [Sporosarcina sp. P21c]
MLKHLMNYIPGKLVPGFISLLSIYMFARIFTQEEYGNYSFVFAQLTLLSAVLFSWIRLSAFRFFNIYQNKKGLFYRYLILIYMGLFILFLTIVLIYIGVTDFETHLNNLFLLGVFMLIVMVIYDQVISILRVELESKVFAYYEIVKPIISVSIVLILVLLLKVNEAAIMFGLIISNLVLITHFVFKRTKKYSTINYDYHGGNVYTKKEYFSINKEFLYYGLPLTFSFLFANIISSSDRILIKYLLDAESVAKYALAYDITSFATTNIFMILNFTFVPVIMKLVDSNKLLILNRKIKDYFNILLFVTIPVVIFLVMFSQQITEYILGDQYNSQDTIRIIQLIAISSFIAGIKSFFFDFSFQFGKDTKKQIYPIMIGGILNVLLNLVMIPQFGIIGAVYATNISYLVALIISVFLGQRVFKMNIEYKTTFIIILSYFIFTLVFIFIKLDDNSFGDLVVNISIFFVLILIVFYLFRNILLSILKDK